jgi:hypothetical protein
MSEPFYLTKAQAAALCGVHPETIRRGSPLEHCRNSQVAFSSLPNRSTVRASQSGGSTS